MNGREPQHSGGTWRVGKHYGAVVSDEPVEGAPMGADDVKAYGGYLIAESIAPCNQPILSAAPEMYDVLEGIEWSGTGFRYDHEDHVIPTCPSCEERSDDGHHPDCRLDLALRKARGDAS